MLIHSVRSSTVFQERLSDMSDFGFNVDMWTLRRARDFYIVLGKSGDVRQSGLADKKRNLLILLRSGCPVMSAPIRGISPERTSRLRGMLKSIFRIPN